MNFAINYSPQAADLLGAGQIRIDRFKCPAWPDLIAEARAAAPVYVHFDLVAGGGLDGTDWALIDHLLHATDTPFVNVHLSPVTKHFPDYDPLHMTPAQSEAVIAACIADIAELTRRYGSERVIVENVPVNAREELRKKKRTFREAVDPAVFTRVLDETGAHMLFDLSHARISADTLGLDAAAYIRSYPLERVRELHITGIQPVEGEPRDHMHLSEQDWRWFDWVMDMIGRGSIRTPWMVAFEYGGVTERFDWRSRPDIIASHVPRMLARVQRETQA
jgi:uncharacterized protein (UPF0276 family)